MRKYVSDEQALAQIKTAFNGMPNPVQDEDEQLVRKVYDILRKRDAPTKPWATWVRNLSLTAASLVLFFRELFSSLF